MGIDTAMNLWYIVSEFLYGLFCKNVHILVKRVTFNKVAFLFAHAGASPCRPSPAYLRRRVRDAQSASCARRYIRDLIAVIRNLIATPCQRITLCRRVATPDAPVPPYP